MKYKKFYVDNATEFVVIEDKGKYYDLSQFLCLQDAFGFGGRNSGLLVSPTKMRSRSYILVPTDKPIYS